MEEDIVVITAGAGPQTATGGVHRIITEGVHQITTGAVQAATTGEVHGITIEVGLTSTEVAGAGGRPSVAAADRTEEGPLLSDLTMRVTSPLRTLVSQGASWRSRTSPTGLRWMIFWRSLRTLS
uniref:Uncharacterized protein n=1 Tax=Cacopsylla melanoneura TaxID=428564 RepID=A0A8D8XBG3_9HEMI